MKKLSDKPGRPTFPMQMYNTFRVILTTSPFKKSIITYTPNGTYLMEEYDKLLSE